MTVLLSWQGQPQAAANVDEVQSSWRAVAHQIDRGLQLGAGLDAYGWLPWWQRQVHSTPAQ